MFTMSYRGACGPHPANSGKRHRPFWKVLKDMGVWEDDKYLIPKRKEVRTVRDDRRDIIPKYIITVSDITNKQSFLNVHQVRLHK